MKKTVSVNIKGTNFLIEEDAYELLQDYLDRLNIALKNDEDAKEIIEDVELRIAEICSSKLSETKSVIELNDIEAIISTLGDPSDFVDEDEQASSRSAVSEDEKLASKVSDRRLFRDGESSYIGGVCSGLANYFGIDPIIVRLLFFIFSGVGIPIYIILWILVPKAETTIDKLRMKGQPITVESVKKEVNYAAENIKTGAKSLKKKIKSDPVYKDGASRGKKAITTILGLGFFGFAIFNLIGFLILVIVGFEFIPVHGNDGFISVTEFGELILSNPGDVSLAWIGGFLTWGSFILFLFLMGSLLLFRIKSKWTKFIVGGLILSGIIGVIVCISLAMRTARDFAFDGEAELKIGSSNQNELVIIPRNKNHEDGVHYSMNSDEFYMGIEIENGRIISGGIDVLFVPTSDSSFHIRQNKSAHASSGKMAKKRSDNIVHHMELINDTLYVDVDYSFPKKDKWRDQDVMMIIEIPEGKSARIDNQIIELKHTDAKKPQDQLEGRIRRDGSFMDDYHDSRHHHHHDVDIDIDM